MKQSKKEAVIVSPIADSIKSFLNLKSTFFPGMNVNVSKNKLATGAGIALGIFSLLFGALVLTSFLSSPGFDLLDNLLPVAIGSILFAVGIAIFALSTEGL